MEIVIEIFDDEVTKRDKSIKCSNAGFQIRLNGFFNSIK